MTTQAAEQQPIIGNAPSEKQEETPERLKAQIEAYVKFNLSAGMRKERLTELMKRKSAKKWDAAKKARMVRKLVTASEEFDQSEQAIDQMRHRLEQITTAPHEAHNVAPFVPPPATSV